MTTFNCSTVYAGLFLLTLAGFMLLTALVNASSISSSASGGETGLLSSSLSSLLLSHPRSALSSACDVLESHGFPEGLLPNSVVGYSVDSNGRFTLNLYSPCAVDSPHAYPVNYSPNIAGRISYRLLYDLIGVEVKIGVMWWEIDAISVDGSDLVFKAGPFQASYTASNFAKNPNCTVWTEGTRFLTE